MDDRMAEVKAAARAVFRTPQAVDAWMRVHSPRLGGTPQDLVEQGQADAVLRLLAEMPRDAGGGLFGFLFRR